MPESMNPTMIVAAVFGVVFLLWIVKSIFSKPKSLVDQKKSGMSSSKSDDYFMGLRKSRGVLAQSFAKIFGQDIDEDILQELEESLLRADVGVQTSMELVEFVEREAKKGSDLKTVLKERLLGLLEEDKLVVIGDQRPYIIVMIGVNGSGKTTTIGKLAHRFKQQGLSVMVAAGDTFRAGAIEQLEVWAQRTEAQFISSTPGADPASVVHNAITAAQSRKVDVLLCDTAGRLQAQQSLMDELEKVFKVIKKLQPDAPHETLLVVDATMGQNALSQVKGFSKVAPLSGLVLTKLDGTAKGGAVLAVKRELQIPVRLIGLGEGVEDLKDFNRQMFVDALLDTDVVEEA